MERTISFINGEGSIGHNTRRFIADNVDASRTKNNITLIHEDIKQAFRGDMTPSRFISLRAELKKVINEDEDFICIVKLKNDSVFGEEVLGNGGEPTGEDLMI